MRYRTFDLLSSPFGSASTYVRSRRTGEARLLPNAQFQLLLACQAFDTLGGHAASICRRVAAMRKGAPGPDPRAVEALLKQLAGWGFLTSEDDLRAEALALRAAEPAPPRPVTSVGILTCGRPASLRRALQGYTRNATRHGRTVDFVVVDDSRQAEARARNAEAVQAVPVPDGIDVLYADRARRRAFALELAAHAGVADETALFALLGEHPHVPAPDTRYSAGAADNTLLLHNAGTVSILVDDDVVCRPAPVPGAKPGLALTSEPDPNAYWFFATRREALDHLSFQDHDFVGLYEGMLGRSLRDGLATAGEALLIDEALPPLWENMRRPDARVAIATLGAVGDSGMGWNVPRLFLKGASFERLVQGGYGANLRTRELLRAPVQTSIGDGPFFMGMNAGLDGTTLLPPFLPVKRNCDGVFSTVLRLCHPGAFRCHLPYVIPHDPPEARPPEADISLDTAFLMRTADLLILLMSSMEAALPQARSEARMHALGERLVQLAAKPPDDFRETVSFLGRQWVGQSVLLVEQRLQRAGDAPAAWTRDLSTVVEAHRRAVERPDGFVPSDLHGDVETRLRSFRSMVHGFGQLLDAWPALFEAAAELRADGRTLARRMPAAGVGA